MSLKEFHHLITLQHFYANVFQSSEKIKKVNLILDSLIEISVDEQITFF